MNMDITKVFTDDEDMGHALRKNMWTVFRMKTLSSISIYSTNKTADHMSENINQ